eukprot:944540-Amphidinium_carterae.1
MYKRCIAAGCAISCPCTLSHLPVAAMLSYHASSHSLKLGITEPCQQHSSQGITDRWPWTSALLESSSRSHQPTNSTRSQSMIINM